MVIQGINVVVRVLFWINKFVLFSRFPIRNGRRFVFNKCVTQLLSIE